ncbi:Glycosyl transferase family 2 [Methylocella tundrae]|uniref:Glycosyl transferase family 2 n=1 Tax=Methylocella tundrae TaxID=227605 RepID=A0A8B6M0T7_METTU|nr:glycosyltransferase [Methylocella tundrae]VTZ48344.1 Glycosyl transferase family 2 [Methylocella tundrae]
MNVEANHTSGAHRTLPISSIAADPSRAARAERDRRLEGSQRGGRQLEELPCELSFLSAYGASPALLLKAAALARAQAITPEAAILATGAITEGFYYQSLARHLGVTFIERDVVLAEGARYPHSIHVGVAPLSGEGPRWLAAPRGATVTSLLRRKERGEEMRESLAITTPAHMSRLVRAAAATAIVHEASFALAGRDPHLSAKAGATEAQCCAVIAATTMAGLICALEPAFGLAALTIASSSLFLAAICLRLFAGAASNQDAYAGRGRRIDDRLLPTYSIIVALHREASVVRELAASLEAIDYPRGKLDIKLVIEDDDVATRQALQALGLPPAYEIIVAPDGWPRTKPRALNIALSLVRGDLVAVFDAEDIPAPQQLRDAAARFLREPRSLACLQAQLSIDNVEDSWLTRLFSIEYAVLFDVLHHGMADLGLPLALGGSSNHFRTDVLREVYAWDPWNVTEDADLGLRLARLGYRSATFASTTQEEAPARLKAWLTQRRRWSKGWTQTFVTLSRDPARLVREIGWAGAAIFSLIMINMVFAPLLWPLLTSAMLVQLATAGFPRPDSVLSVVETTLWLSVVAFGAGAVIWLTLIGMKRRKLLGSWLFVPLLLPYHLLMSVAAWAALYDLILRPFHWHKTEHGLARSSRRSALALAGSAAKVKGKTGSRSIGAPARSRIVARLKTELKAGFETVWKRVSTLSLFREQA